MVDPTQTAASAAIPSDFHWPKTGESGFVPVDSLVPDPNQPRQHFNPENLANLGRSMKSVGGQREIMTVRELTSDERSSGQFAKSGRYQIVSGESRWRAAIREKIPMVEIRVRHYASYAEQYLDAWVMNEARTELSDWENAIALQNLINLFGWKTQEEMAKKTGHHQTWISQHLSYLRVHPDVQKRMHPQLPPKERLKGPVVLFLGRLENVLQGELVAELPKALKTVREQMSWLKTELKRRGISLSTRKKKPSRAREMLMSFLKYVEGRAKEFEELPEFSQLFENVSEEQIGTTLRKLREIDKGFRRLVSRVELMANSRRVALVAVSQKLGSEAESESKAQEPASPKIPSAPPREARVPQERKRIAVAVGMDLKPPARPRPMPNLSASAPASAGTRSEFTIVFFHPQSGRETMDKVGLSRYIELWDLGALKFQQNKSDKPASYPTREEAEKLMAS